MEKEITDEQLIELLEGKQDDELLNRVRNDEVLNQRFKELKSILNSMHEASMMEVPAHIPMNINEAMIKEKERIQFRRSSWRVAASLAILLVGFGLGKISNDPNESTASLTREIQALKELTMMNALKNHSASERIQVVNQINNATSTYDSRLVTTLIHTLNKDESPNVRYAALQALSNYLGYSEIRAALVKSLEAQSDPLIQISLINILLEAREKAAIAPLKDIMLDEEASLEVRQQAEIAIQVLI
ncbi:MAG: HEAT repeat domain-containing protein [Bacteroidota bacterium]